LKGKNDEINTLATGGPFRTARPVATTSNQALLEEVMKNILASLYFATCFAVSGAASAQTDVKPDESQLQSHNHYQNRDGTDVHSPAASRSGAPPTGASAKCCDGEYSFSKHHAGTCSRHGGVAEWTQ
jgi:hypothetical protein